MWYLETDKPDAPSSIDFQRSEEGDLKVFWTGVPTAETYLLQLRKCAEKPDRAGNIPGRLIAVRPRSADPSRISKVLQGAQQGCTVVAQGPDGQKYRVVPAAEFFSMSAASRKVAITSAPKSEREQTCRKIVTELPDANAVMKCGSQMAPLTSPVGLPQNLLDETPTDGENGSTIVHDGSEQNMVKTAAQHSFGRDGSGRPISAAAALSHAQATPRIHRIAADEPGPSGCHVTIPKPCATRIPIHASIPVCSPNKSDLKSEKMAPKAVVSGEADEIKTEEGGTGTAENVQCTAVEKADTTCDSERGSMIASEQIGSHEGDGKMEVTAEEESNPCTKNDDAQDLREPCDNATPKVHVSDADQINDPKLSQQASHIDGQDLREPCDNATPKVHASDADQINDPKLSLQASHSDGQGAADLAEKAESVKSVAEKPVTHGEPSAVGKRKIFSRVYRISPLEGASTHVISQKCIVTPQASNLARRRSDQTQYFPVKQVEWPWYNVATVEGTSHVVTHYWLPSFDENSVGSTQATGQCEQEKAPLEVGSAYNFRVAAINSCGRSEWSPISRSAMPVYPLKPAGFPSAPQNVRIQKIPGGMKLMWDPPRDPCGKIVEYTVHMAIDNKDARGNQQMTFVRVYAGTVAGCVVPSSRLAAAHIDRFVGPSILFRISARNEKGRGMGRLVRWLQDKRPSAVLYHGDESCARVRPSPLYHQLDRSASGSYIPHKKPHLG
ncbi:unnamed protein product [Gongylonema pulchrum]|uniref:Fibronectin type-III domain-containing protein n=1 Tax=Gongylonema pulchrum TaxID=637853 RepID=A0A183E368_9BILA|nr:unnamed protein product [Gongylonema pulchrum]